MYIAYIKGMSAQKHRTPTERVSNCTEYITDKGQGGCARSTTVNTPLNHRCRILTRREEQELACKASQNDLLAFKTLIQSSAPYVISIAKKIAAKLPNRERVFEDLVSEGYVGLIKAVRHFDPYRGTRLITYATWWIVQAMIGAVQRERTIRIPLPLTRTLRKVGAEQEDRIAHPHPSALISEHPGAGNKRLLSILRFPISVLSLEEKRSRVGSCGVMREIADQRVCTPEKSALDDGLKSIIEKAVASLSTREAYVVRHRFGLNGTTPTTLQQIGVHLGVQKEAIRRIQVKALQRLKRLCIQLDIQAYLGNTD